jgi:hypothetical protein
MAAPSRGAADTDFGYMRGCNVMATRGKPTRTLIFFAVASILANGPAVSQSLKEQAACAAQAEIFYRDYNNIRPTPGFKLESED